MILVILLCGVVVCSFIGCLVVLVLPGVVFVPMVLLKVFFCCFLVCSVYHADVFFGCFSGLFRGFTHHNGVEG